MPAVLWPLVIYAVITALMVLVPGRWVDGYVVDPATGRPYRYRLNGLRVLAVSVGLWALACRAGWLAWDAFYLHRWELLAGAFTLGLVFTVAIVLPQPKVSSNLAADLYLGRLANPQWGGGRLDAKMWLYLVGATMLELNLLSFAAHHLATHADAPNPGVFLSVGLFSFFVMEYLFFEEVHLYTYDFMAERVGFKLGWGCLVFYPFFYGVGLWNTAPLEDPRWPAWAWPLVALVFFTGWAFARGANMQKFWFKRDRTKKAFGVLAPTVLTDGERHVLAGGFWGLSRHINYLGEMLMATGLALATGHPGTWQVWLYPLYYVALLVPRQVDDDKRCAAKYGPLWQQYVQRVPWRIIPFVY
jgi:protein-S-isoprenylcysteine O-methyltransferase Ste14